jgi:nucleoside-diphosphate-sugar epimerase
MIVLVTGASGNIGKRVVQLCRLAGHEVLTLGRNLESDIYFDFLDDAASIPSVRNVDLIVHTAWFTKHPEFWRANENILFAQRSFDLIAKLSAKSPPPKIIVTGSCAELYPSSDASSLGNSKEWLLRSLFNAGKREHIAWLQLFFAYGPGEPQTKLLSCLKRENLSFEDLREPFAIRDFISFDQIANIILSFIESFAYGVYQVGTGRGVQVSDIWSYLAHGTPLVFRTANSVFENGADVKIAVVENKVSRALDSPIVSEQTFYSYLRTNH